MHVEILISLFGKISSAGKKGWTRLDSNFIKKKFQNQRFYKIQRTGLGIRLDIP